MQEKKRDKPYTIDKGGLSRYFFPAYIVIIVTIIGSNKEKDYLADREKDYEHQHYNNDYGQDRLEDSEVIKYTFLTTPEFIIEHIREYKEANSIAIDQVIQIPIIEYHDKYFSFSATDEQELISEMNSYSDMLANMSIRKWVPHLEYWFDIQYTGGTTCKVSDFLLELQVVEVAPKWDNFEQANSAEQEVWNDFYSWSLGMNDQIHKSILLALNKTIQAVSLLEEECNSLPSKVTNMTNISLQTNLYNLR
jgi:predicted secreted Zn-dependent protease